MKMKVNNQHLLFYSNSISKRNLRVRRKFKEFYERSDIACGVKKCRNCLNCPKRVTPCLDKNPKTDSSEYKHCFLLPNSEALLNQIDVFEDESITNVILLLSEMEKVRKCSSTTYKRIIDINNYPNKKFYLFDNVFNSMTMVKLDECESEDVHLRKLFYITVNYLQNHIERNILVLFDETPTDPLIFNSNLTFTTVGEFVSTLNETKATLESKLRVKNVENARNVESKIFPAYLTQEQVFKGIRKGILYQGKFHVNGHNFLEGFVQVESFPKPVLISGYKNLNRAIDNDTVAVYILPKDEWSVLSDVLIQDDDNTDLEQFENRKNEECELIKKLKPEECQPTGKIVGIIRRKHNQCCGIVENSSRSAQQTSHIFIPADRKYPRVRIETRSINSLLNKKIVVAIDEWPRNSRYPLGHFVRIIGDIGDKNVENEVLLLEHDVPFSRFSDLVKKDLPKLPWIISDKERSKRTDFTNYWICSVDPPGCTDIDDALHCFRNTDGTYSVGVHIADVSHFIRPNTALDEEAAKRGTTVYLVDRRIDMVPELLSSNLCSLRENVDRFAFSCCWILNENADIISTEFYKSVIHSKASFTYEEAQLKINSKGKPDMLTLALRDLNKLAKKLKARRLKNGALLLSSPEVRFHVDSETHDPLEVQTKIYYDTMSMVEEFMLLANISVAKRIYQDFPECAVLRRHPEPPASNFEPLVKAARNHGFDMKVDTGKNLQQSLNTAVKKNNPTFNNMLRILATRCMQQAVYFSSGSLPAKDYFHYGLATEIYTHFTSPIRRYADIMVHRLLAATTGTDVTFSNLLENRHVTKICENLNYRNRMAQYAARASVALNTFRFFKNKQLKETGSILFVRKNALHVLIPRFGLEGTVYLEPPPGQRSNDGNKYYPKYEYIEENQTIVCNNVTLKTFDNVVIELQVDSTNIQHEKLVFTMIEPIQIGTISLLSNSNI